MKVGLTLYGSIDTRSGGFRYDRRLVQGLRAAGETVELVELPWRTYRRGLLDNGSRRLRDRLAVDVDVMLQDELAHPSLARTNRHLPYPIVSVVHHLRASEPRPLSPLYRAVERRYLATVDAAVCTSTVTQGVVTDLGVDAGDTLVAPPAGDRFDPEIDETAITRRASTDSLQVVFVGTITKRKGLDTLVHGLARAAADVDLTVVGRPADTRHVEAIRQRIRREDLADRVEFLGAVDDDRLADVLRASHVLAVPSRYEGFGIVYLEGMSFGLPALASTAGGATDVVTDGETGRLVPPDDPAAVARALEAFAGDDARLARMGHAARRRYEAHPDLERTVEQVRHHLRTVAGTAEVSP